mgnify:CR=1 FL=1
MTRRTFLAAAAVAGAASVATRRTSMGVTPASFPVSRLGRADELGEHCAKIGAGGCQAYIRDMGPAELKQVRGRYEELGLYLEVQTGLARDDSGEFERTVIAAKEAGATSLRCTCLSGRRYENFDTLAAWKEAVAEFKRRVARSVPICEKHKLPLGLENHKDWTAEEYVALMKEYESAYLGACIDTGNNLSLLDDPYEIVEAMAPYGVNCHFKDMGVEEYEDGFLLAEVPLGEGFLDMRRILDTMRAKNPKMNISLEMISRNPLKVPCLTDKYWATFPNRNGAFLARTWRLVKQHGRPIPTMDRMSQDEKLAFERDNIERSIVYARDKLGLV